MTCVLCGEGHAFRECPHHPSTTTPIDRHGDVLMRPAAPWTPTVHTLLRHLRSVGFTACPEVVGDGFDERGREVLTWIEGRVVAPQPWDEPEETLFAIGEMMRDLHTATSSFGPPADASWRPWTLREEGPGTIVSHGNIAPWSVVVRDGRPVGFIEWQYSGPLLRLDEIAATGWYCCHLVDDDVAEMLDLPDVDTRAGWLRAFLDGYELPRPERRGLVTRMVEFAVRDTASFARMSGFTISDADASPEDQWLMTWQIRAGDWLLRHRSMLEGAIER